MLLDWLDSGTEALVRAMPASAAPAPVMRGAEWADDEPFPELDDFDAPPAESTPPPTLREEINAVVPLRQPKPSVRLWLRGLEEGLAICESREEVEAAILSEEVLRASRTLKGDARTRLQALIDAALARHGDAEDEPFEAGA
jgi:hypothetical protein